METVTLSKKEYLSIIREYLGLFEECMDKDQSFLEVDNFGTYRTMVRKLNAFDKYNPTGYETLMEEVENELPY